MSEYIQPELPFEQDLGKLSLSQLILVANHIPETEQVVNQELLNREYKNE